MKRTHLIVDGRTLCGSVDQFAARLALPRPICARCEQIARAKVEAKVEAKVAAAAAEVAKTEIPLRNRALSCGALR